MSDLRSMNDAAVAAYEISFAYYPAAKTAKECIRFIGTFYWQVGIVAMY